MVSGLHTYTCVVTGVDPGSVLQHLDRLVNDLLEGVASNTHSRGGYRIMTLHAPSLTWTPEGYVATRALEYAGIIPA